MSVARTIGKVVAPMRRRAGLMVGRAVVKLVNDALKMQGVQIAVLADEVHDNVERMQDYGFTSHPHPDAEAIVLAVGGSRNHAVVIRCEDRRYRLQGLEAGEVAMYDDLGTKIVFKRGNVIEVTAGVKVQVNAPLVNVTGGDVVADGISLKTHVHGGVDPGGGTTGVPE